MKTTQLLNPPKTIMELYKALPEGTMAELIDNAIYMSPSPATEHQRVLNKINIQIFNAFEISKEGEIFIAPLDVYLDEESNAVQPDIIVVLNNNAGIVEREGYIHGVPDVLIEILSPGNRDHDLIKKKNLYERFCVKEYWIVDPETRQCTGYAIEKAKYKMISDEFEKLHSPLLNLEILL